MLPQRPGRWIEVLASSGQYAAWIFRSQTKYHRPTLGVMDTHPTATNEDAAFIYHEWDARTRAHDIESLLALYTDDAILESPLVARILDRPSGLLRGKEQLRPFFQRGTDNRPNELVQWYRTGRYLFDGQTLMWEYPRAHTDGGDQVDLVEVMDLNGPQIAHHRIYWGWFGTPLLTHASPDQ